MRFVISGCVIVMLGFVWVLCAASKQDIGIDEYEEQDKWLREYEEKKQQKRGVEVHKKG